MSEALVLEGLPLPVRGHQGLGQEDQAAFGEHPEHHRAWTLQRENRGDQQQDQADATLSLLFPKHEEHDRLCHADLLENRHLSTKPTEVPDSHFTHINARRAFLISLHFRSQYSSVLVYFNVTSFVIFDSLNFSYLNCTAGCVT